MKQVALRRQQSSEEIDPTNVANKTETLEALLAQKRVYQKHLRNLQQTSLARDILKGMSINFLFFRFKF